MLKKFIPLRVIKHFSDISVDDLVKKNIKLVLCDIDNTLVGPDDPDVSADATQFINDLTDANIEVVLISNNTKNRVNVFNETLNLKTYPMALKPFQMTYRKIKKDYKHIDVSEMISIGDQVLTDVLGSNRANIKVILTDRIEDNDLNFTKVNRFIENFIVKKIKKRKMWPDENM